MKLLVTGTGRCGTGYMAQVLTRAGLSCGHEAVFTPHDTQPFTALAESSWLAVPYLKSVRRTGTPVALVYRHPGAVISSLLGIRFFEDDSPYREFAYTAVPALRDMAPLEAACHFYDVWNRWALSQAATVFNIEDIHWETLVSNVPELTIDKLAEAITAVPTTYNHRERANLRMADVSEAAMTTFELLERASNGH